MLRPQAEGGGQSEQGGEDRQGVDDVAHPAPNPVAKQGMEGGADGERQPAVVGRKPQGQGHHPIDRPGMQAPVVQGGAETHGLGLGNLLRCDAAVRTKGRRHAQRLRHAHMENRLQNAEEHQADAHPGSKQHGEPSAKTEVRGGVRATDLDAAPGRCHQQQAEQHEQVGSGDEKAVKGAGQHGAQPAKRGGRLGGKGQGHKHEHHDAARRNHKDGIVDVKAIAVDSARDVVLADHIAKALVPRFRFRHTQSPNRLNGPC